LNLFYTKPQTLKWYVYAEDVNGNINKILVTLTIKVPNISIEDVNIANNLYATIVAKLSSQIDT
jgi:hypothetical protein